MTKLFAFLVCIMLLLSAPLGAGSDEELPAPPKAPAIPIDLLVLNATSMNLKGKVKSVSVAERTIQNNDPDAFEVGGYSEVSEFDEQGRLTAEYWVDDTFGRTSMGRYYQYDEKGRVTIIETTNPVGEKDIIWSFEYDSAGNLISKTGENSDGYSILSKYTRTNKGELIEETANNGVDYSRNTTTISDSDGSTRVATVFFLCDDGESTQLQIYDKNFRLVLSCYNSTKNALEYDSKGNLTTIVEKIPDGEPDANGNQPMKVLRTVTYEIKETDSQGNWTERQETQEVDGKIVSITGFTRKIEYYK